MEVTLYVTRVTLYVILWYSRTEGESHIAD